MENSTVAGLRSRSRSKTPFLRSSCDRENSTDGGEPTHHKSGRKTPIRRSTPVKQSNQPATSGKVTPEPIIEVEEVYTSPPAHRTRSSRTEKLIKTSDYSSEESPDRLKGSKKEIAQNKLNYKYEYERVSTSSRAHATSSLADFTLSPIQASYNVSGDRSRIGSPAYSACSTDSSFAEQALADASTLLDRDPAHSREHLPYRLYKMAGEYWNKYPKTDYTYSRLSKDRVELAPGQVAVPNMSRRSLSQFRIQGPNTSADEVDQLIKSTWNSSGLRKRFNSVDASDDEGVYQGNGGYTPIRQRWWITRLLITILTTITTTTSTLYGKVVGPPARRYYAPADERGFLSRTGSALGAPFYWVYTIIKKVVTITVTTITETVSPSRNQTSYAASRRVESKRRWWPWLLLLLLPVLGYGCYNYGDIDQISQFLPQQETKPVLKDTFKPPEIDQDPNLARRIAALEDWAVNVDVKLRTFDQKLNKLDNLEAQIESYSLKHLQQNLITILNIDNANGDAIAAKFKNYFDKHYVTRDQMQRMSQEIHERLISSWKPEMDEDKIRQIVQEYLSVFERRQLEILVEKVREYVKEVQVHRVEAGFDAELVKKIVAGMLEVYDADKTGLVDFALESAGGQIISTKCTELYQIKTKQYSVLGLPVWWVYTSPRFALTPGAMPAECWAFQGFPGYLVVRTYAIIEVTGFSLEHMSRLLAVDGKIESAPKNFSVYGLQDELDPEPHLFGDYMYDANGAAIQYFPVQYPKTENIGGVNYPVAYDIVELRVESNYGNPTYTCVYRFRVHGNPLSDIKMATEDSIRDSES